MAKKTNIKAKSESVKTKSDSVKQTVSEIVELSTKKQVKTVKEINKKQADKLLSCQRFEFIYSMVISGVRQREIINICRARHKEENPKKHIDFDISDEAIRFYIRKVQAKILKQRKPLHYYRNRSIARKDDLYMKSIQLQDFKSANSIDDSLNKLLGFDKQVIEHTQTNQLMFGAIPVSKEALEKLEFEDENDEKPAN